MHKQNSAESGSLNLRVLCSILLVAVGCSLAFLSYAATPPSGSISTGGPVPPFLGTWDGTARGVPPAAGGESSCTEGTNCDSFALTITGTPADWATANKQVHVEINWLSPSSDYDLFVHKGDLTGPVVAESASGGTTKEQANLNPTNPSIGTGLFTVHVVYFAATSADQYHGSATVVVGNAPPVPAPVASGVFAPRFENYNPPPAGPATLGLRSGEPSIGFGLPIAGHPEGRALYQSDVQTLRVTFNGCTFPRALWENKPAPTSVQDFDPILFSDFDTGRTFVSLLSFAGDPVAPQLSYTDTAPPLNDGDAYVTATGARPLSGIDHQTVGSGPYHAPLTGTVYPHAIYYCSQALVEASCARSDDGGQTYGPAFPTYRDECGGLHGHIKIAPDGTAYLPNKGCGGEQAAVVSEDNGMTWAIRPVPGSVSAGSDPAVAIDNANKVYFGYANGDTKAVVTTSIDHGATWSQPYDVGASFGINNVVFPAFIAGDNGRAAMAFLGTSATGGLQGNDFRGVWHLYVATTYDGGATWTTVDATPADAVQRGCVWLSGGANVCRNMLDFMDVQKDHEGRIVVGFADGCAGAECAQAPPNAVGNSYTALASIARQSGGMRLLTAFDSAPDVGTKVPGTPAVTALRNGGVVHVAWSEADNGGSAITGYNIYRSTTSNTETLLASVGGSQTKFDDATAIDPTKTYYYKVEAVNAQGASCKENEIPAKYSGDSHTGTGFTVAADPTGDQTGSPANMDLDIQSLSILEPGFGQPNAGLLVFNLKVADLHTMPDQRMWRVVWNDPRSPGQQFYVGMTNDSTNGGVTFEYGTVATATVGLVLGVPSTTKLGAPDFGAFDLNGLITIAVSRNKIGNVQIGDILGAFSARTYPMVSNTIRSTTAADTTSNAAANDLTANSPTYTVVGPLPQLISAVSRKTHGTAGTFDINLPVSGTPGVECRRGGAAGNYTVVFTFATNVSVTGASVTPGPNSTASVSGPPTVSGGQVTVNLTNVSNVQTLAVNLLGVNDGVGTGTISVPMSVLQGDTTADRSVNSADVSQTKSRSGQGVGAGNFRSDVTIDGSLNSADVSLVKSKSGSSLP